MVMHARASQAGATISASFAAFEFTLFKFTNRAVIHQTQRKSNLTFIELNYCINYACRMSGWEVRK